jgi:hypothetical protein
VDALVVDHRIGGAGIIIIARLIMVGNTDLFFAKGANSAIIVARAIDICSTLCTRNKVQSAHANPCC